MLRLKQSKYNLHRFEFNQILKRAKCKTADDVVALLFNEDFNMDSLVLKKRWIDNSHPNLIQRINIIWVYPVFFIMVPFRYLVFGKVFVNVDSKFGAILRYLIGELS